MESPQKKSDRQTHFIQFDDVDIEFSKYFTQSIKSIQHQNSQRANSIFRNDSISIIYSYISILELKEPQSDSPTKTSRHTIVRQELDIFSKLYEQLYNPYSQMDYPAF